MFDAIVIVVFELLLTLLIIGTLREWWASKRDRELLPIFAYGVSMLSFVAPRDVVPMHPWEVGFIWLLLGVVLRVLVRRKSES